MSEKLTARVDGNDAAMTKTELEIELMAVVKKYIDSNSISVNPEKTECTVTRKYLVNAMDALSFVTASVAMSSRPVEQEGSVKETERNEHD
jgi:hypothetical protein